MTPAPPTQPKSLLRRYAARLGANLVGLVFNVINISIVPRALGPALYGNFEFLVSFFQQITGFIDTGTSSAFYNKLSRRNEDMGLLRTYGKFVVAFFFVLLLGLSVVWLGGWSNLIWPHQEWKYILLAALVGYLAWVHEIFRKVIDAFGYTIRGEIALVIARAMGAFVIVVLFMGSWLSLATLFLKELLFYVVIIVALAWIAAIHWRRQLESRSYSSSDRSVIAELWVFSSPLLVFALVGVITGLADRWLLQRYAGSQEQGFYGLSFRIAGVSLIFSSAMTQLIMREYSIAHGQGNTAELLRLFRRYVPMLYTVAAYFAAFISVQSETVVWFSGGANFTAAGPAMMVMALYPIHQTYGQMNGAFLFATEQTMLYRNIGVIAMLGGLVATWFLIAPIEKGGFAAGSMGLALKMVSIQFVAVNVQLWFNLKNLGLRFGRFLAHQIAVVAGLLLMAWISRIVVSTINISRVWKFFASGITYTVLAGVVVIMIPAMVGMNRAEMHNIARKFSLFKNEK